MKQSLCLIIFWLLSLGPVSTQAESPEALQPLSPQEQLRGLLRIEPSRSSPALRELRETDQIRILRSQDDWYEVEVLSQESLIFRGWVHGEIAEERLPPDAPEKLELGQLPPAEDYFIRPGFRWFWDGQIRGALELSGGAGAQILSTQWSGQPANPEDDDNPPPSSRISGLDLYAAAQLRVFQFENSSGRWTSGVKADYHFGNFQVNFASDPSIPSNLRGQAYQAQSHRLRADLFQSWHRKLAPDWQIEASLGLGAFYLESAPDLDVTVEDSIIFSQLDFLAPMLRLGFEVEAFERYRAQIETGLMIFPQWSETPKASDAGLSNSGLPLWVRLSGDVFLTERWGVQLGFEAIRLGAQESETSTRANRIYQETSLSFSQLRANVGLLFRL